MRTTIIGALCASLLACGEGIDAPGEYTPPDQTTGYPSLPCAKIYRSFSGAWSMFSTTTKYSFAADTKIDLAPLAGNSPFTLTGYTCTPSKIAPAGLEPSDTWCEVYARCEPADKTAQAVNVSLQVDSKLSARAYTADPNLSYELGRFK